jgi:hypothetical protein
MAARIFRSAWASESAFLAAMAGAGAVGDLTGTTAIRFITTIATTPGATPFTTEGIITGAGRAAVLATPAIGRLTEETSVGAAEFTTVGLPGPSTETIALPEDTLRLAVRAACGPARSVAMTVEDRRGPFPLAEARA